MQQQHISRRELMELPSSSDEVELKDKRTKSRTVSSGVANSFGFKRRVVSAPPPTEPVQSFCDVITMETKLEAPAVNKFGFRSRSVSRTNSNNSVNITQSSAPATTLVKKPLDNNHNTQLVTNINRQPVSKISSTNLVKHRSSSEINTRPSNLNRLTNTTTSTTQNSSQHIPRNINSRSGIPSLRPVSTSGIPNLVRYSSGNVATGNHSNLPSRGSSTRPTSWGSCPWSNGADKTAKPIYANTRSRTSYQAKPSSSTSTSRPTSANKLPRRRLEMVTTHNDRGKFELKDVEVTQVVPIKADRKPVARGTVYETLCKPTPRRPRGLQPSKPSTPARPLSSLLSSSDDSDHSETDSLPANQPMKPLNEPSIINSGSEMDGGEGGVDMDVMEGSGDTMAIEFDEEEVKADTTEHSLDVNTNMRSILLNIEDPAFAVLAAMSTNERLEDIDSPSTSESTDLVLSPPVKSPGSRQSKVQPEKAPLKKQDSSSSDLKNSSYKHANNSADLDSPSTPTNVSFSDGEGEGGRGQDFLIDDEISDQPGLVFDEDQTATLHHRERSRQKLTNQCHDSPARSRGTLSPCSSIASEDLMLDFELSEADNTQRLADKTIENLYISNPTNTLRTNHNNNYTCEKVERESTYVGAVDSKDDEEAYSISTDSGYSFLSTLEDEVASIKTELVTLRSVLSREQHGFVEKEADLKRQIMLLKQECLEQVRVASLLREELEVYKIREERRHKLVMKSNAATQTDRSRPSSLGYVSEGSDGSTRSLISSDEHVMSQSLG